MFNADNLCLLPAHVPPPCACAVTIARITEATTRALARPEIRAKLDAWNQSRIGSKVPEERKVRLGLEGPTPSSCALDRGFYIVNRLLDSFENGIQRGVMKNHEADRRQGRVC